MTTSFYTLPQRGFTLVELLVVIAVISLLVTIVTGQWWKSSDIAKTEKATADIEQIRLGMRLYIEQQGHVSYPPGVDSCSFCAIRDSGNAAGVAPWEAVIDSTNLLNDEYKEDPWGNPYAYDNNLDVANPNLYTVICSLGKNETLDSSNFHNLTDPPPDAEGDDICVYFK